MLTLIPTGLLREDGCGTAGGGNGTHPRLPSLSVPGDGHCPSVGGFLMLGQIRKEYHSFSALTVMAAKLN